MVSITTLKVNQIIVREPHCSTLFSYDTPIVTIMSNGQTILHDAWNYSATTAKYRNKFLNEGIAETRSKLLSGKYIMKDYNETTY